MHVIDAHSFSPNSLAAIASALAASSASATAVAAELSQPVVEMLCVRYTRWSAMDTGASRLSLQDGSSPLLLLHT